ncbi:hypothetical protein SAMN05216302_100588 [Nitrosomonas aestuarii]|uniref:Uncharacterized protein n=1 Tax=Nitrosomonas aestuarii TaxID=52441 RepID=A0A1I3Z4H1_9PROT|nr:hypothetical protein SAMN05216302_100588 [Nitrosomonas aestuarii]
MTYYGQLEESADAVWLKQKRLRKSRTRFTLANTILATEPLTVYNQHIHVRSAVFYFSFGIFLERTTITTGHLTQKFALIIRIRDVKMPSLLVLPELRMP